MVKKNKVTTNKESRNDMWGVKVSTEERYQDTRKEKVKSSKEPQRAKEDKRTCEGAGKEVMNTKEELREVKGHTKDSKKDIKDGIKNRVKQ